MTSPASSPSRPYRISCIEPLPQPDEERRRAAAEQAGLNVSLLDSRDVVIDLKSDSGTSSRLAGQLAAVHTAGLAGEDGAAHRAVTAELAALTGKRHVVLFAQGRAAEAALIDALPLEGSLAAANCIFPSTRFHLDRCGAQVVECARHGLVEADSREPFKGDLDLEAVFGAGSPRPSTVWVELASNGAFGQPVSLACLDVLGEVARERGSGIYIDATRCIENAVLLRRREAAARPLTIREIVRRSLEHAHAVTASCLKSFHAQAGGFVATDDDVLAMQLEDLSIARGDGMAGEACEVLRQGIELASTDAFAADRATQTTLLYEALCAAGVPVFRPEAAHAVYVDAGRFAPSQMRDHCPAKAVALALYLRSGVRVDEHFLPDALAIHGMEVIRIAVPARRYADDQILWVAEQLADLHARQDEIQGLARLPVAPGIAGSLHGRFAFAGGRA